MDIKIIEIEFATPEFDNLVRLRQEVLWIPLGLEFTTDELAEEYSQFHLGAYINSHLVGGLSLKPAEELLQIRQVVVKEKAQKHGIGKLLIEEAESVARSNYFKKLELDARDTAINFYTKLGFEGVGERFIEMEVEHLKMMKKL